MTRSVSRSLSRSASGSARRPRARHVAVVVENVPAGVDTRLRKQLDDLLAAGYRVSVVTMRDPDNDRYRGLPGMTLLEYPPQPQRSGMLGYLVEYAASFLWASALLARLRIRGRIDVLQLCQPPDIYFPLGLVLGWAGARVVVDQRDLMPELLAARYARPPRLLVRGLHALERATQRVADHTLTVNEYLRDRLVAAGAAPERVSLVRNGPVLARVQRATADPSLRGPHTHLVCWTGKMGRQDRVELVIEAAERVVRGLGREDCGFAVLGDGECLDELRQLVVDRGLERWVRLPGWLTEAEVFGYLATAAVGVDTSLQAEVSPVKALEYLAAGLPLVAFDLPETRRITEGAATLVHPGDVDALARAVVDLLDDPDARRRLGTVGRDRVRDDLAWERQSLVYLSVLADDGVDDGADDGVGGAGALPDGAPGVPETAGDPAVS
ncbi:MAG: glycosyltransferase family 4 protein [Nocardioidaceae bacterium]